MTQKYDASSSVVRRLPRYYRLLGELERNGQVRTSSRELGRRLGMTASQIRQDLCCFGCFGQQGSGYSVAELRENLQKIMGLTEQLPAIVVGAGSLGKVVSENVRFEQRGFRLVGIFDIKPADSLPDCRSGPWTNWMIFVLPISRQPRCCVCRKNRHRQWRNGWFRWEYGDCGISVTVTSPWSRHRL